MPSTMSKPAYLSPSQIADALSMSRRQVYRWMEKGELDSVKIDNARRISEKHLAEKLGDEVARDVFESQAQEA